MSEQITKTMLDTIEKSIRRSGYHAYFITGGAVPRFAYTIGLRQSMGGELILAGAMCYSLDEVKRIMDAVRQQPAPEQRPGLVVVVDGLGSFTLRRAHDSWIRSLMLGAIDYYGTADIVAWQIVPDEAHRTIDTPDLEIEWSGTSEPIWKWLHEAWPYPVSPKSTAVTNMSALRGARITEATRWEADGWELFAGPGPDVTSEEARVVPLGALLAADPSLAPVVDLDLGDGLWRDGDGGEWHRWGHSPSDSDRPDRPAITGPDD